MSDYPKEPTSHLPGNEQKPKEEPGQRRGSPGALFAVGLIVVGAAVLMNNMGVATINWGEALRYWPVILILVGLDIMLGRGSVLGSAVMALVTVVTLVGVLWVSGQVPIDKPSGGAALFSPGDPVSGTIQEDLQGVKSLRVEVQLSQMALTVGAQDGGTYAAQGEWNTVEGLEPEISYEVDDGEGVLTIQQPDENVGIGSFGADSKMTLNLPTGIPIELVTHDDLGEVRVDLSALNVTSLDANASSGNMEITLPSAGQMRDVGVHGDLGSVTVKSPDKATLNMETLDVTSSSGNLNLALPAQGTIGELSVKGDLGEVEVTIPDDATLQLGSVEYESSSGNLIVALPSQGKADDVTIRCDLGAITLTIPGKSNTLTVDQLDVEGSSGNVNVTLPGGRGDYQANIKTDLGGIIVALPSSLEVLVNVDEGLARAHITSTRLTVSGEREWETGNYDNGDNRALVSIESGSGNIEVKDQPTE